MKRKTATENPEVEEKRGRVSNGSYNTETSPSHHPAENGRAQHKCSICLWPVGAPQCYHTSTNTVR